MDSLGEFCAKIAHLKLKNPSHVLRVSWIFGKQTLFVIKTLIALGEE